ncbi:FAD/NAD(P)-binding protein, partial [Sphingomonas segetis]|uniref:FAD/NAD(P)-binding protein n=1 Tax=Sphingomonas segetis TaxID=1104779 RepID=UPI003B845950
RRSAEVGWRAAVDSLRPYSHALWQSLCEGEQERFLRHARPWWDVHRHRIAPEVAATIARMIGEGRLRVMAGWILAAAETPDGIEVELRSRGADASRRMTFAYAFNCTGPLHSIERTRDPLLRSLLDKGEVRPDQLGIGLAVDEQSRAGERLWALGPLTKGRYWEIVAVPDIREQAAAVAADMARELEA